MAGGFHRLQSDYSLICRAAHTQDLFCCFVGVNVMDGNFFLSASPISLYSYGRFCPPGDIWPGPQTNLVGEGYYWHLVSRSQGCCKTSTMHRTAFTPSPLPIITKDYLLQNVISAKVRNPAVFFLYAHIHRHPQNDYHQ